jgi:hypothetical protein
MRRSGEKRSLMGSKPVSSLSGNLTTSFLNITMDKVRKHGHGSRERGLLLLICSFSNVL